MCTHRFYRDDSGVSFVEYGTIATLVLLFAIGSLMALGVDIRSAVAEIGTAVGLRG